MQLDIITRTMVLLDQRLTHTEDQVSMLVAHSRGLSSSFSAASKSANSSRNVSMSQDVLPSPPVSSNSIFDIEEEEDRFRGDNDEVEDIQGKDEDEEDIPATEEEYDFSNTKVIPDDNASFDDIDDTFDD